MGGDGKIRKLADPLSVYTGRHVFWFPGKETSEDREVNEKMCSAFRGVKSLLFKRIMFQFWRTPGEGKRNVLGCYLNPFAHLRFDRHLIKYRSRSILYLYSIDGGLISGEYPPKIITGGLPATTFQKRFSEVVLDLRVHKGSSPLVDLALECDLTCCMMLPVICENSSECVGVVECSMNNPGFLLPIFNELKSELKKYDLSIYHVQGSWPYKDISGDLDSAKIEIEKGLKMACESHGLTLAQVWISFTQMEREFLLKLSRYSGDSDADPVKEFYENFDVISGKGLACKTLETNQAYMCKNVYKLSENSGVLELLSANTNSRFTSCTVICLKSTHTGQLNFAFEFFWPQKRNHFILLESLQLTLSKYLSSFKFSSGELLGDKISFVEVQNSCSESGSRYNDDDVAILALYRNSTSLFFLPISFTFENLMENLKKEFDLNHECKLEYEVNKGQWCSLVSLETCPGLKEIGLIKLHVLAVDPEVCWRWITKT